MLTTQHHPATQVGGLGWFNTISRGADARNDRQLSSYLAKGDADELATERRDAVIADVMGEKGFAIDWMGDCRFADDLITSAQEAYVADDRDRAFAACKAIYTSMERFAQDVAKDRIAKQDRDDALESAIAHVEARMEGRACAAY